MINQKWLYTFDVEDLWKRSDELTTQEFCKLFVERLREFARTVTYPEARSLANLIEDFESLADDEQATYDDFDFVLDELYDWADNEKTCWIRTI